jgi:hypothetical protein
MTRAGRLGGEGKGREGVENGVVDEEVNPGKFGVEVDKDYGRKRERL